MRVLIALLYYLPHRTGYSIYVQSVAEALAARGHDVTVLCARHDSRLPRHERCSGVRVERLWSPVSVSRGMVMPGYPGALRRLLAEADVVLVNTPMAESALVAAAASRAGVGLVATHHGDLVLPKGPINRIISGVMLRMNHFMARRARALVAPSQDYASQSSWLQPWADRVRIIDPPVRLPAPDLGRSAELRRAWCRDGGPLIGFSGRFVAEKRPDLLLRALPVLRQKYPGARLVFAGEYDIRYERTWARHRQLVEGLKPHIELLGRLTDPQAMADYYAALDVLALPSDTDCFALVQVEAMMSGTPVVASDAPGGRMTVRRTGMGRNVPRGDAEALARGLVEVLSHPEAYRRPRAEVLREYSFERTIDAYESCLGEARPGPRKP